MGERSHGVAAQPGHGARRKDKIMNATKTYKINRCNIVPSDSVETAAWLADHGVIEPETIVVATADITLWAQAGYDVHADGRIGDHYGERSHYGDDVQTAITLALRADPHQYLGQTYDATSILVGRIARLAADAADRERSNAEDEAQRAAERAATEASNAVSAATDAQRDAAMRAWIAASAADLPAELVRASAEGRSVRRAARECIEERATAAIEALGLRSITVYDTEPVDRVPTAAAYAIRDALVSLSVPGAAVDVSDFLRADVCPTTGRTQWVAAVRVDVTVPWLVSPIEIFVPTEPVPAAGE